MRQVSRVSCDGKRVIVRYNEGDNEFEVSSKDKPLPEFLASLQALGKHVGKICELPAEYTADLVVRGVTVTYTKDAIGAVITAAKKVTTSNSPFMIHTPHTSEAKGEKQDGPVLGAKTVEALETLATQALAYVDGKRAQGELFAPAEPKKK